jgi:hypothetical protein
MRDHLHGQVPEFLRDHVVALREPAAIDPARRRRVMDAVRRSARREAQRDARRRTASSTSLAIAAGIAALITLGTVRSATAPSAPGRGSPLLGDTVVATLRDTMRLVRFMLVAPAAQRVALAGDFNGWSTRAHPLERPTPSAAWTLAISLPPGRHRYAFVVDDTQWVRDPLGARDEGDRSRSVVLIR